MNIEDDISRIQEVLHELEDIADNINSEIGRLSDVLEGYSDIGEYEDKLNKIKEHLLTIQPDAKWLPFMGD